MHHVGHECQGARGEVPLYVEGVATTDLHLEIWRESRPLATIRVSPDFTAIVRSERLVEVMHGAITAGGVICAAVEHGQIVGYATLVPSSALTRDRWEGVPDLVELGALEVARSCRRRGLATAILHEVERALDLDAHVAIARGMAGHWEPSVLGVPWFGYRSILLRLLARVGFRRRVTDDPAVMESVLDFLAVREGACAPPSSISAFVERCVARRL